MSDINNTNNSSIINNINKKIKTLLKAQNLKNLAKPKQLIKLVKTKVNKIYKTDFLIFEI